MPDDQDRARDEVSLAEAARLMSLSDRTVSMRR